MRRATRLAYGLLYAATAGVHAAEGTLPLAKPGLLSPAEVAQLGQARDSFGRPLGVPRPQTPLAEALGDAWKKDPSEANLKAWSEVLIKCQQSTNPAWTTALMRSDPPQAHCYRY